MNVSKTHSAANALPFTGDTIFRWTDSAGEIAAMPVARIGQRAVLLDTEDRYFVADVKADGRMFELVCGPVTVEESLHAAECVIGGLTSHLPVSTLVNKLAIGLVAQTIAASEMAERVAPLLDRLEQEAAQCA